MQLPNFSAVFLLFCGYFPQDAVARMRGSMMAPPPANPWSQSFSIKFSSNLTADATSSSPGAVAGALHFDSKSGMQRVDFEAGAPECKYTYNTSLPCTLFQTSPGHVYRMLTIPGGIASERPQTQQQECCRDTTRHAHAWAPHAWITARTPSQFVVDSFSGLKSQLWGTQEGALYQQVAMGPWEGRPLTLNYPLPGGQMDFLHFSPSSMSMGLVRWELPQGCEVKCDV